MATKDIVNDTELILPLIVIVGETASGKSKLAMYLARLLGGEIICGDSRTIYRGMDTGTAKPSVDETTEIPHHLLDVVDPGERYTAAEFQRAAKKCIKDIYNRGKVPIMVGGSGLYVDSVIFDYDFRPKNTSESAPNLASLSTEQLYTSAVEQELEPVSSTNRRYLLRLLEAGQKPPDNRRDLRANTLVIGIKIDRKQLRANITNRVENMFKQGLRKEVEKLLQTYSWQDPGMSGIGYREFEAYYRGETSMGQVKQKIVYDTLQFAKRQRTWFKRNPLIKWVGSTEEAIDLAESFTKHQSKEV